MGNHVAANLITIPSEAQRNKWGKGKTGVTHIKNACESSGSSQRRPVNLE